MTNNINDQMLNMAYLMDAGLGFHSLLDTGAGVTGLFCRTRLFALAGYK